MILERKMQSGNQMNKNIYTSDYITALQPLTSTTSYQSDSSLQQPITVEAIKKFLSWNFAPLVL